MLSLKEKQEKLYHMLIILDNIAKENGLKYQLAYGTVLGAVRHKGFIPWDSDIDIIVRYDELDHFCSILKSKLPSNYKVNYHKYDKKYDSLKARIGLQGLSHHDIHIDIFPIVGLPDSSIFRSIYKKVTYLLYRIYFFKNVNSKYNYTHNKPKYIISKLLKILLSIIPINLVEQVFTKIAKKFPIDESNYVCNICGSYGKREIFKREILTNCAFLKFGEREFPVPKEWDAYLTQLYGNYMIPKKRN